MRPEKIISHPVIVRISTFAEKTEVQASIPATTPYPQHEMLCVLNWSEYYS